MSRRTPWPTHWTSFSKVRLALQGARGLASDHDETALDIELAEAIDTLYDIERAVGQEEDRAMVQRSGTIYVVEYMEVDQLSVDEARRRWTVLATTDRALADEIAENGGPDFVVEELPLVGRDSVVVFPSTLPKSHDPAGV